MGIHVCADQRATRGAITQILFPLFFDIESCIGLGQTGGPESQRSTRSLLPRFGLRALLTMLLRFFFKWILRVQLGFPGCR